MYKSIVLFFTFCKSLYGDLLSFMRFLGLGREQGMDFKSLENENMGGSL
jgi:vacuolar-type H+-ATPase subunit I/STV1